MLALSFIKDQLREGKFAWPGGYPKFFLAENGDTLSFETVKDHWREVCRAHMGRKNGYRNSDWTLTACDVNWEDSDMICAQTMQRIESAYEEPKEPRQEPKQEPKQEQKADVFTRKLYQHIAGAFVARENCRKCNNLEWLEKHESAIKTMCFRFMPSGSGADCGTTFVFDRSKANSLVFHVQFHHMNEHGFYDGWTYHNVRVVPDLVSEIAITISGPNRNDIKDYLCEIFRYALMQELSATKAYGE